MATREDRLDVLLGVAEDVGRFRAHLRQAELAHATSSHRRRTATLVTVARRRLRQAESTLERIRAAFLTELGGVS